MDDQLQKVRHDYIRYANCWEDADILLKALRLQPGDRVLSIGSAGDNSFSLLTGNPELVVAVDINPVQLKLIELKKAAIAVLEYDEFLQFLGFRDSKIRKELFEKIKPCLDSEACDFWKSRFEEIEKGVIHQGKFERYFRVFQSKLLPLIHSEKRINGLFEEKNAERQQEFYREHWNNRRWKMLFKIFFSRFVMGRAGRDPQFLKEVEVPVSDFIYHQAEKHLGSIHCQDNYFLHYILTGNFGPGLPHYAREENFGLIRERIDHIVIYHGLAGDAFEKYGRFNKFNLSDIFEYMKPGLFRSVAENLFENGMPGSRYAYWNLMVPRRVSEITPGLEYERETSKSLSLKDKGFFYGNFITENKQA